MLCGYSYYSLESDRIIYPQKYIDSGFGFKPPSEKKTEYFVNMDLLNDILDTKIGLDKPKPTQLDLKKAPYNVRTQSEFDKISKFIDGRYEAMIDNLFAERIDKIHDYVKSNQQGYTSHSSVTPMDLINQILPNNIEIHLPYILENFNQVITHLNRIQTLGLVINIVRVYDEDYSEYNEYLMLWQKEFISSDYDPENTYHIIDNTNYKMDDWNIGINVVSMPIWRKHVISIGKFEQIIEEINQSIDIIMSECNDIYPILYPMYLEEIENKLIESNARLKDIINQGYHLPESVILNHLRDNYVSVRYEAPVSGGKNEGMIMMTRFLWTTEYVISKEIDWKRGDKSPVAFQLGDVMRIKKG